MMRVRLIKKFYCVVIVFLVGLKNVAAHVLDGDTTKLIASLAFKNKASNFFFQGTDATIRCICVPG